MREGVYPVLETQDVRLAAELMPEVGVVMHVEMKQWGAHAFRKCLAHWAKVLNGFAEYGVKALYCLVSVEDDKHLKFVSKFGFSPFTAVETNEGKFFLCECEV